MDSSAEKVLFDKDTFTENTSILTRWMGIVIVVTTFPWTNPFRWIILGLILNAVGYNFLRRNQWLMSKSWFHNRAGVIVLDEFFVIVLTATTGGLHSPYLAYFLFMIISAGTWYGLQGTVAVLIFDVWLLLLYGVIKVPDFAFSALRFQTTVILTYAAIGIYAERLTQADRVERKLAEKVRVETETEQQRLLALINNMAQAVIAIDEHGRISLFNGAALDLLNTNLDIKGKDIRDYLKLQDQQKNAVDILDICMQTKVILRRNDLILKSNDGSFLNLEMSISPVRSMGRLKDLGGYILIFRDITKEWSVAEQRDDFISLASHELKTPIAIIEANLSTALLPNIGNIDPKAKTLIEQAHKNTIFLGELVRDLTTLSKADREALEVELVTIDPVQLVKQLASDYQEQAKAKGLEMKISIKEGTAPILTSEFAVREILQNYITNAIKYTDSGSVTLGLEPAPEKQGAVFWVKDTGIGIAAADKQHLFSKFYRSEDYRTRKHGGTGLGLYITQKLAQRLNGEVWYESKLNAGSTFYLKVPPIGARKEDSAKVLDTKVKEFIETV